MMSALLLPTCKMRINMEKLKTEEDEALCHCYDKFTKDVKNDPKVPHFIKRVLCEKIWERGGERLGPKKTLIYQLIEAALQHKDGGVICEGLQYDDKHYYGMIAKVEDAVAAVKPIVQHANWRADIIVPSMMSWPPEENREDQLIILSVQQTMLDNPYQKVMPLTGPLILIGKPKNSDTQKNTPLHYWLKLATHMNGWMMIALQW